VRVLPALILASVSGAKGITIAGSPAPPVQHTAPRFLCLDISDRATFEMSRLYPDAPRGEVEFFGIPFLLGRRCIDVFRMPATTGLGAIMPACRNAGRIHFLYTCRGRTPGGRIGSIVIHFEDGTSKEIPLVDRRNVGFIGVRCSQCRLVQTDGLKGFQMYAWGNPHPDKGVSFIDVLIERGGPDFHLQTAAVTLEAAPGRTLLRYSEEKIKQVKSRTHDRIRQYWLDKDWVLAWREPETNRSRHPYLLFTKDDIAALRAKARSADFARVYHEYRARATDAHGWDGAQYLAVLYLVEGKRDYAVRAKQILINACDSVRNKIVFAGLGAYATGRALESFCETYDAIVDSGVFTDDEDAHVRKQMAFIAYTLMNPRYFSIDETGKGGNWNTDRYCGVGMFAMCFPAHPKAKEWLAHCIQQFEAQLHGRNYILPDGAVPESLRYHGGVLRTLVPLAYMLKRNAGKDFFTHPRFRAALDWFTRMLTPPDPVYADYFTRGGRIRGYGIELIARPNNRPRLIPGIGDGNWVNVWVAPVGWAVAAYKNTAPAFAARLAWTWHVAGCPVLPELTPGHPLAGFVLSDLTVKPAPQRLTSWLSRDIGYAVMRSGFGSNDEGCLVFNCGPFRGHQHNDRGSFSFYAHGVPLSLDPGVGPDYGISLARWYALPQAHNLVTFGHRDLAARGGGPDGKDDSSTAAIISFLSSEFLDYACGRVPTPPGVSKHVRHIVFMKPDCFMVWDEIDGSVESHWNFHAPAAELQCHGDKVIFSNNHGVDLELTFLQPSSLEKRLWIGEDARVWRSPDWISDTFRWFGKPKWIKVTQMPGADILCIIHSRKQGESRLQILRRSTDAIETALEDKKVEIFLADRDFFRGKIGFRMFRDRRLVSLSQVSHFNSQVLEYECLNFAWHYKIAG